MTKQKFLRTETGTNMRACIQLLDEALEKRSDRRFGTIEYEYHSGTIRYHMAQWEVYKILLRELFGREYCFSRTDEYFGVCTEDERDWLFKVERLSDKAC